MVMVMEKKQNDAHDGDFRPESKWAARGEGGIADEGRLTARQQSRSDRRALLRWALEHGSRKKWGFWGRWRGDALSALSPKYRAIEPGLAQGRVQMSAGQVERNSARRMRVQHVALWIALWQMWRVRTSRQQLMDQRWISDDARCRGP